jgi:hypothetical protein
MKFKNIKFVGNLLMPAMAMQHVANDDMVSD